MRLSLHGNNLARPRVLAIGLALIAVAACKQQPKRQRYTPGAAPVVAGVQGESLHVAITTRLNSDKRPSWVSPKRWDRVKSTYALYQNAPLWLEADGVKDRASALLNAIKSAPDNALSTDGYPIDSIEAVVNNPSVTKNATAEGLADADVLMTAAYVAYATDMLTGQVDPKSVSQDWHVPLRMAVVDSALGAALQETSMDSALAAMAPTDSDYVIVKDAFVRYRKLASAGGWAKLTSSSTSSPALRQRLLAEGFLTDTATVRPASQSKTGAPVTAALKAFQSRHGLQPTGSIDKLTLAELNITADERVKQLAVNLERRRWLPRSLGERYIYVNVPAFRLDAYDSGQRALTMKVVVGAEYEGKSTPVFSDTMETVVFRPYWNITPTIQAKEIGPKAAANPGYLAANDMEYYKDGGATRIRQKPGDKNSLGLVKFLFPNNFNIYLHDTPAKSLFGKANRAASHGCIRLEHPDELAQFVLGWDVSRVRAAMNSGANNSSVRVPGKLPVYIVYFTAYARDGEIYFGDDIYNRDDALEPAVSTDTASRAD